MIEGNDLSQLRRPSLPAGKAARADTTVATLQALLTTVAQSFGARDVYLLSTDEPNSKVIVSTQQIGGAAPRSSDVIADVRYGDALLARLVVASPSNDVDEARLAGFALAAGYILGNAGEAQEIDSAIAESRVLRELGMQFGEQ